MRIQELREAVGRQPFEPLRLVTTDGAAFELRHPDLCMFGVHGTILVGVAALGLDGVLPLPYSAALFTIHYSPSTTNVGPLEDHDRSQALGP